MAADRTPEQHRIGELLVTARESLGLSLAFLTRMDGAVQTLEVVESSMPMVLKDGITQPRATSLCQAILEGRLPPVIPDLRRHREAMRLPAARWPRIRSYVSVPVRLSDGCLYGTFCAAGFTADKGLTRRDQSLLEVLARAAAVIIEPGVRESEWHRGVLDRLRPLIHDGGPRIVLQPIVDLRTGVRLGAEALSRFPPDWQRTPDVCFAEAHRVGLGDHLELLALARASELLMRVRGYVSMNVSPQTLITPQCGELLATLPGERILLELSEHGPVNDYDVLRRVLDPLRQGGMRLAIDDVGAGFSSLRHIVLTSPEVIKLDRSIVAGVADDPVIRRLVSSLVAFGHGCGAVIVAEGVETDLDAEALVDLDVDAGQGWAYGRPEPVEEIEAREGVVPTGAVSVPVRPGGDPVGVPGGTRSGT